MPIVHFGSEQISFEIAPGDSVTEREPADGDRGWNCDHLVQALESARFDKFLAYGKPLVIINDAFRPTPTGEVLSLLNERYPALELDFIIACGNHPEPSDNDLHLIFGPFKRSPQSNLFFHDSQNYDDMVQVGALEGQSIYVNKNIFDYPTLIAIGSVEPHYFAGFTGGRKSIIPGLSDIESNRKNHAKAVSPEAQPLRLSGNPVEDDLELILKQVQLPPLFSIQTVAGRNRQILGCFCGSLEDSFAEAVDLCTEVYSCRCDKQYDLVITEMRAPLDRNLYQIQKAIENWAPVVRDNGTIIAVSACREGIGNDEFYQLARQLKNEDMVLSHAELDNPPLGIHKLSRIVQLGKRIRVKALTGLKHEILEQVFIEPVVSIDAELQKLKRGEKKDIDILLVREAGLLAAKVD